MKSPFYLCIRGSNFFYNVSIFIVTEYAESRGLAFHSHLCVFVAASRRFVNSGNFGANKILIGAVTNTRNANGWMDLDGLYV